MPPCWFHEGSHDSARFTKNKNINKAVQISIFACATFAGEIKKMQQLKSMVLLCLLSVLAMAGQAQCSICTKTASQLGRESAQGLNGGIIYLMFIPFAIAGYIGFKWWKQEKQSQAAE